MRLSFSTPMIGCEVVIHVESNRVVIQSKYRGSSIKSISL